MDDLTIFRPLRYTSPFNGAVEIGLRALVVLNETFPKGYSLQRLIIFDYLLVHSDDISGGPTGLHPQTPHRGGEILVRRNALQEGLFLYLSRGLIERRYESGGVYYSATDRSAAFLDSLSSQYIGELEKRALWAVKTFDGISDADLQKLVQEKISGWGVEFALESVLWTEGDLQ